MLTIININPNAKYKLLNRQIVIDVGKFLIPKKIKTTEVASNSREIICQTANSSVLTWVVNPLSISGLIKSICPIIR